MADHTPKPETAKRPPIRVDANPAVHGAQKPQPAVKPKEAAEKIKMTITGVNF